MIEIVIDGRERAKGDQANIRDILARIPDVRLTVENLDAGDFKIKGALIERKSGADFVASILDGRLFPQVDAMRARTDLPIILLEGSVYKTVSDIDRRSIDGAISWLTTLAGVQVIPSSGPNGSASLLYFMAKHLQEGLGYIPPYRSGKPSAKGVQQRYLLEGLPGVGPSAALALIQHFGSVIAVVNASVAQLCEVKGIGKGTAEKIYQAVR